jgi:hypothetical protein
MNRRFDRRFSLSSSGGEEAIRSVPERLKSHRPPKQNRTPPKRSEYFSFPSPFQASPIPTGLPHSTQGLEERATLGLLKQHFPPQRS